MLSLLKNFFKRKEKPGPLPLNLGMDAMLLGLKQRGYTPKVVYDIGAAVGDWTRNALGYWPECRFVCFEPLTERRKALEQLEKDHPGKIQVLDFGLGDVDGELPFGVTPFLWDSSFAYAGESSRSVRIQKLDTLIARGEIPYPDFIKIDVQGYERKVIGGGMLALQKADFVLMECTFRKFCAQMSTLDETIGFMSEKGFIPYEFVDFLRRPLDGAMGQCDILFIRKGHSLLSDLRWG